MGQNRPLLVRTPASGLTVSNAPSWLRAILGIPLEFKVLGANLVILMMALIALLTPLNGGQIHWPDLVIVLATLGIGACVSYLLVRLALKPVQTVERVAWNVSQGRLSERVPGSLLADRDLAHLTATLNQMLDNLAAGRDRMRKLGAEVVYAQERERAQVARDLHDSIAQTLAAATFQLAATGNKVESPEVRSELATVRELLRTCLEEIRSLSRSLHPRVADDLGLPAALEALADVTRQRSLIDVKVKSNLNGTRLPAALSTTLYRVAQEALRNVEMHADAGNALVSLTVHPGLIELEVTDDGCGLDDSLEKVRNSSVLARMRQRLSLAGGELHIHSTRGCGTRVVARARLETEGEAA